MNEQNPSGPKMFPVALETVKLYEEQTEPVISDSSFIP